jgi:quercetin dioxygenase-like cupin family protein
MKAMFATGLLSLLIIAGSADAQEMKRMDEKRAPPTGKNMDIFASVTEVPPGTLVPLHKHAGEEVVYILQGAIIKTADGSTRELKTGTINIVKRELVHAGITVAGRCAH